MGDRKKEQQKQLRQQGDTFLTCRELLHAWDTVERTKGATISTGETVMTRKDRCLRCDCIRTQTYRAPTMVIVSTDYKHPEGYTIRGTGRISTFDVRKEAFRRAGINAPRHLKAV